MPRYFFDIVSENSVWHDFQGREFACPESARRQGELIAIDLRFAADGESGSGDRISVCDPRGTVLFSIPVPAEAEV